MISLLTRRGVNRESYNLFNVLRKCRRVPCPKATIVGIDIDTNCKSFEDPENNIFVEVGDQGDASFLEFISKKFGPFDIIIDDGGHKTSLQIISFNSLYGSSLNDDGIYLVEDVHSNYWPRYQDTDPTFVDFVKPLIDLLHEPYFESRAQDVFREESAEQLRSMKVSNFCANTRNISFYDSIIVFERRRRSIPVSEIR